MAPPNTDEERREVERIILQYSKAQQALQREDSDIYQKFERIGKVSQFIWFIGAGLVAVTVWVVGVQAQLSRMSAEIEQRKATVERVNEMWFMKEHGISNKEAFERTHGYPAPSQPTIAHP